MINIINIMEEDNFEIELKKFMIENNRLIMIFNEKNRKYLIKLIQIIQLYNIIKKNDGLTIENAYMGAQIKTMEIIRMIKYIDTIMKDGMKILNDLHEDKRSDDPKEIRNSVLLIDLSIIYNKIKKNNEDCDIIKEYRKMKGDEIEMSDIDDFIMFEQQKQKEEDEKDNEVKLDDKTLNYCNNIVEEMKKIRYAQNIKILDV